VVVPLIASATGVVVVWKSYFSPFTSSGPVYWGLLVFIRIERQLPPRVRALRHPGDAACEVITAIFRASGHGGSRAGIATPMLGTLRVLAGSG
jgi:hypothetical protein